jgi:Uma2 family endonuclease
MEAEEPLQAYQKKFYTIQEYLEMENNTLEKHEYYKGEIFAMSGASARHNVISSNIFIALGISLKGKNYRPYGSDMRVNIPENTLFILIFLFIEAMLLHLTMMKIRPHIHQLFLKYFLLLP